MATKEYKNYQTCKGETQEEQEHKLSLLNVLYAKMLQRKVSNSKPLFGASVYTHLPSQARAFEDLLQCVKSSKGQIHSIVFGAPHKDSYLAEVTTYFRKNGQWVQLDLLFGLHPELAYMHNYNSLMQSVLPAELRESEEFTDSIAMDVIRSKKCSLLPRNLKAPLASYHWYETPAGVYYGAKAVVVEQDPNEGLGEAQSKIRFAVRDGMIATVAA